MPTVSLQEHLEKMALERMRSTDLLAEERELRYQQVAGERERRYQELRAADAKALDAATVAQEKAINAALAAQEKAAAVTESRTAKSFADANEWRMTYGDRDRLQVPRLEYSAGISNLAEKIDNLGRDRDRGLGRAAGSLETRTLVFALIGLIFAAVAFLAGRGL